MFLSVYYPYLCLLFLNLMLQQLYLVLQILLVVLERFYA